MTTVSVETSRPSLTTRRNVYAPDVIAKKEGAGVVPPVSVTAAGPPIWAQRYAIGWPSGSLLPVPSRV